MSNLLTEKVKSQIRSEYRARFILAGSFLAMGAALFTVLVLSPSYTVLFMARPAAAEMATQAQQNQTDSAEIARAQMLVTQLAPVAAASSSVTSAISGALAQRPAGVRIDTISYVAGSNASISLGGTADSRETMDKFRATLQKDARFTSVKLPVGDLVGSKGGRFTITINGKF